MPGLPGGKKTKLTEKGKIENGNGKEKGKNRIFLKERKSSNRDAKLCQEPRSEYR